MGKFINWEAATTAQTDSLLGFAQKLKTQNELGQNEGFNETMQKILSYLSDNLNLLICLFPRACCDVGRNGGFYQNLIEVIPNPEFSKKTKKASESPANEKPTKE